MYNSFLVYKKISVDDVIDTHLKFKLDVIEELMMQHIMVLHLQIQAPVQDQTYLDLLNVIFTISFQQP